MKTTSLENKPASPSPFEIALLPGDFAQRSIPETAPSPGQTPFSDMMMHPEKLEAALKAARSENDAFDASRSFGRGSCATTTASSASNGTRKSPSHLRAELKVVEFYLQAPSAVSVRLAADFTDWGRFPLDMIKSADGVWSIFVPLPPGIYSYRFIIDGKWCDDPHSNLYEINPFGTANAVVEVA